MIKIEFYPSNLSKLKNLVSSKRSIVLGCTVVIIATSMMCTACDPVSDKISSDAAKQYAQVQIDYAITHYKTEEDIISYLKGRGIPTEGLRFNIPEKEPDPVVIPQNSK